MSASPEKNQDIDPRLSANMALDDMLVKMLEEDRGGLVSYTPYEVKFRPTLELAIMAMTADFKSNPRAGAHGQNVLTDGEIRAAVILARLTPERLKEQLKAHERATHNPEMEAVMVDARKRLVAVLGSI